MSFFFNNFYNSAPRVQRRTLSDAEVERFRQENERQRNQPKTGFVQSVKDFFNEGKVTYHGQYGGPSYSSGKTNSNNIPIPVTDYRDVEPSDKLDQLFKIHDIRYELARTKQDIINADKLYIQEFEQIKSQLNPGLLAKGWGAKKAFEAKLNFPLLSYSNPVNKRTPEEIEFLEKEFENEYSKIEEENPRIQQIRDTLGEVDPSKGIISGGMATLAGSLSASLNEAGLNPVNIQTGSRQKVELTEERMKILEDMQKMAGAYLTKETINQNPYIQQGELIEDIIRWNEDEVEFIEDVKEEAIEIEDLTTQVEIDIEPEFGFDLWSENDIIDFILDDDD